MEIAEDRTLTEVISNSFFTGKFRNLSGLDFDRFGSLYLSDMTAGKIWRVQPDRSMQVIAEFLISPSCVKIDRRKHMIMVPYLYADGAEINGLEQPINTGKQTEAQADALRLRAGVVGRGRETVSKCVYCQERKGKRPCPALSGAICSQCCGTHRIVSIACHSDCVYLDTNVEYQQQRVGDQFEQERRTFYRDHA